ncbi:hypothetical protein AYO21_11173 [Fonsecaea monophora]|uniref:Uncharacterized protein n=1 Tax=Fonsecaea monophora TaxID=254056 RepID=A0A177ETA2_9EURO|nr:hypothetical protein AYO21_11173 [Fonsecaea monophora]OAG34661.1 hypothetical protein AYO21_11173 [Fonsecaea monophora]
MADWDALLSGGEDGGGFTQNPYRQEPLDLNLRKLDIPVPRRRLRKRLLQDTDQGGSYLQAFIRTELKPFYKPNHIEFGQEHQEKTIDNFWQYLVFTDEFHFDTPRRLSLEFYENKLGT